MSYPATKTLPTPKQTRRTEGSKRLTEYTERNGLSPVAWYVPVELHAALTELAARGGSPLQAIVTAACIDRYGNKFNPTIPPLTPPTSKKTMAHKSFTWYAPEDLHTQIKVLAANIHSSQQQLITSAVVDACKDAPEIVALGVTTGVAPYPALREGQEPFFTGLR